MASRGNGAKNKGAGFERKLAQLFTEWWNKEYEGSFTKTPASGGLRWKNRSDVIGDLCTPSNFTATIEAKNREDWEYSDFFRIVIAQRNKDNIGGWWHQAVDEGERAGRTPILVIKKNFHNPILLIENKYLKNDKACRQTVKSNALTKEFVLISEDNKEDRMTVNIFDLFVFLNEIPPSIFCNK